MKRAVSFDLMEVEINKLREKYAKHLAIQIWYYYKKYKVYKKIKDAAERKRNMDKLAKM